MTNTYDLIQIIYKLSSEYNFNDLNKEIDTAFGQWQADSKWSEISSILFALDLELIKKRTAELILEKIRDNKKHIALYKQFWQASMDAFGGDALKMLK